MTIGKVIEPVPVTGLAANFSPTPRIAPPPMGKEMVGAANAFFSCSPELRGVRDSFIPASFDPVSFVWFSAIDLPPAKEKLGSYSVKLMKKGCVLLKPFFMAKNGRNVP
jgi:hypothetical protein